MNIHNKWYVVYTCPNSEKKIYNELSKRSITAYLPTRKVIRQWCDRKKKLEVPLFPNYVFVKVVPQEMSVVLMVNGVVRFVSFNGAPAVVHDAEVDVVKRLLSEASEISNEACCLVGEKVQVKRGPLTGLKGRVVDKRGITRLYIDLEGIHQVISINIDVSLLEKID